MTSYRTGTNGLTPHYSYTYNMIYAEIDVPPATPDGRAPHSQVVRDFSLRRRESHGQSATSLRGRVDSAKAEEILAGLGFNVDEASSSAQSSTKRRCGRRRTKTHLQDKNKNKALGEENRAGDSAAAAGTTSDKQVLCPSAGETRWE